MPPPHAFYSAPVLGASASLPRVAVRNAARNRLRYRTYFGLRSIATSQESRRECHFKAGIRSNRPVSCPYALSNKASPLVPNRRSLSTAADGSEQVKMYTTSFAFFEALWEAGVTHCFVNLGSDHPSIIEAMVKGQREHKDSFPRIITCPNEVRGHPYPVTPFIALPTNMSGRWLPCPWQTASPA